MLLWKSVHDELPPEFEEVVVLVDGHRNPAWTNSYLLIAYRTRSFWIEERHSATSDPVQGVVAWARIEKPSIETFRD